MFDGKLKAVTFSYDDAVTQDIRFIELLDKYNLKCTFNINSELLGKENDIVCNSVRVNHSKVPADKVKEIYKNHEVAVHTLTHPNLKGVGNDDEVIRQVEQDRTNLENLVGYNVQGMAYPCGGDCYDERVIKLITENTGVKYARTTNENHLFDIQTNLLDFSPSVYHMNFDKLFELGEKFIDLKPDSPKLFYVWGHTYEFDVANTWDKMEKFLKMISGRDDIFYGTNQEVLLGTVSNCRK